MSAAFSLDEQIDEVRREIDMRERVYKRWVELRRMSQATADRQIACMRAVLETLRRTRSDLCRPDPLAEALNSGDGAYRP